MRGARFSAFVQKLAATAAQLNELVGGGPTTLHSHAGGGVIKLTRTLTSTELLANAPVELLAEPEAADEMVVPIFIATRYNPGETPYTIGAGIPSPGFQFKQGSADGWTSIPMAAVLNDGNPSRIWNTGNTTAASYMGGTNRGLTVVWDNPLTLGDGTVTITVAYLLG